MIEDGANGYLDRDKANGVMHSMALTAQFIKSLRKMMSAGLIAAISARLDPGVLNGVVLPIVIRDMNIEVTIGIRLLEESEVDNGKENDSAGRE